MVSEDRQTARLVQNQLLKCTRTERLLKHWRYLKDRVSLLELLPLKRAR